LRILVALALLITGVGGSNIGITVKAQEPMDSPLTFFVLHSVGPDGGEATATIALGGALSVEDLNTGERFVFLPSISPASQRQVLVKVFQGAGAKGAPTNYFPMPMRVDRSEEL